jgi:bifunctional DNase/RNase
VKNEVIPVQIRGILPANNSCALFVGTDKKVFVIQVEPQMGAIIGMFLRDTPKERPLTHDLINRVFLGFGITVERVVITDLKNSTYFARLILLQQNELHTEKKIVELDARPSDCLALAAAQKKPVFVSAKLFESVEDMSSVLEKMNESGEESD